MSDKIVDSKRAVDREWTVDESLQAMDDIDYLEEHGQWREIPEWAKEVAEELHLYTGSAGVLMGVLMIAYEKSAKALRKYLRETFPGNM